MLNVAGKALTRNVWINGRFLECGPAQRVKYLDVGFDWGRPGSGSYLLALAILLELTGDATFATAHYLDFCAEWVERLPHNKDFLGWSKIDEWIINRGGKIKNSYKVCYDNPA